MSFFSKHPQKILLQAKGNMWCVAALCDDNIEDDHLVLVVIWCYARWVVRVPTIKGKHVRFCDATMTTSFVS
jgi:hypothetical protein